MHAPCESARQKTGYCSLNLFFQFFYTHDILYITKIDILNIHHIRYVRVFTSSHSPYCSHKTLYNTCSLAAYRLLFHYTSNADKIVSIFLNTQILDERRRFFCCFAALNAEVVPWFNLLGVAFHCVGEATTTTNMVISMICARATCIYLASISSASMYREILPGIKIYD